MIESNYERRGQVTIFIILAMIIVAAVALYFIFRGTLFEERLPPEFQPVYNSFLSCVQDYTLTGVDVIESQGGYIELPDFETGSEYAPFSSQLLFLGNPIPYWYYISGNNLEKEQVPSVTDMENQLNNFVSERLEGCDFEEFYEDEFVIEFKEPEVNAQIKENKVDLNLIMDMTISQGENSVTVRSHKTTVDSNLGRLYDAAKKVYDYQQENLFLEDYGIDILRNYAPVDGVEISCSPKIWTANEIFDDLEEGIEANTLALNVNDNDYFNIDLPVDEEVKFLTSGNWPNAFEVAPSDENLLIAEPVGNQQGLGVIGFCYVPYHFVYDMKYPILIQVVDGDEIFQFPMAVVIDNNNPRESLGGESTMTEENELCVDKNTEITVRTYDTSLNPIDADISYECVEQTCDLGSTTDGTLETNFPQCVNGYIVTKADGFAQRSFLFSTIESGNAEIILDRLYPNDVALKVGGKDYEGNAIMHFVSEDNTESVVYPEQTQVELSEGIYEVEVYVYEDSEIEISASTSEQCFDVARGGLGGILGLTEEKCVEIEIPEQIVSNALAGGGKQEYHFIEDELRDSTTIEINVDSFPEPNSLEKIQDNYELVETSGVDINFV